MPFFAKKPLLLRNREQNKKETRKPPLPCTYSLIPESKFNVHVFDYLVELEDGTNRSAVGYKTNGLKYLGQQEIILILLNDERKLKRNNRFFSYSEPLEFFRQLYHIAEKTQVAHGSSTKFVADRGLLGSSAILYIQMPKLHNLIENGEESDCLAMVLLFGSEERQALSVLGHLRILGLLGHKSCYFPFPYWSDLQRTTLFQTCSLSSSSVLALFTARLFLPGTSTITHHPLQKRIILKMKTQEKLLMMNEDSSDEPSFSQKLPRADIPTILFPGNVDGSADGFYVRNHSTGSFDPGEKKKKEMMITNGVSKHMTNALAQDFVYSNTNISQDKSMACCFLALVGQEDRSSTVNKVRMMEDGFFVHLSEQSWTKFWENLLTTNVSTNEDFILTDDMELSLVWVP